MKSFLISHKGKIREKNEDFAKIYQPENDNHVKETILILSDGMGGYEKGDVASRMSVIKFKEHFESLKERDLPKRINKAIKLTNNDVYDYSIKTNSSSNMGATIALVIIYNEYAVISNVGDSRVYLLREKHLKQISKDHNWVTEIGLSKEEADKHPQKNVITRSIGRNKEVKPYTETIRLRKNDVILICSDGLNAHVTDDNIKKIILKNSSLKSKANALFRTALNKGGTDNISIILACIDKIRASNKLRKKRLVKNLTIFLVFLFIVVLGLVINRSYFKWSISMPNDVQESKLFFADSLRNQEVKDKTHNNDITDSVDMKKSSVDSPKSKEINE